MVFAKNKRDEKDLSLLGKNDEENIKKIEATQLSPTAISSESRFSMLCKDSSGKEFKKGDVGYDTCLSRIKTQHDMNKLNSGLNKKDDKGANSASFNFKIGD
jgi:hypothetical protein